MLCNEEDLEEAKRSCRQSSKRKLAITVAKERKPANAPHQSYQSPGGAPGGAVLEREHSGRRLVTSKLSDSSRL
jgi:hypothetical protein